MERKEHLEWAKKRAIEYAKEGDRSGAYSSLVSDLQKHPDLSNHAGIELGMMLMMTGKLVTQNEMVEFINGFN